MEEERVEPFPKIILTFDHIKRDQIMRIIGVKVGSWVNCGFQLASGFSLGSAEVFEALELSIEIKTA